MSYLNYKWDLEVFIKLICAMGESKSDEDIAKEIGLKYRAYINIIQGKCVPQMSTILKIADYFAVPIDVLMGRCSKEDCDKLLNDYSNSFKLLRRYDYEDHLYKDMFITSSELVIPEKEMKAGWPYNLLDILIDGHWAYPISEDQENGLNYALSLLTKHEQIVVNKVFMEEKALASCAKEFGVTRENIRQIKNNAIRKLKHPVRLNNILYGFDGNKEMAQLYNEISRLKNTRDRIAKTINSLRNDLLHNFNSMNRLVRNAGDEIFDNKEFSSYQELYEMDLSVRAFNCLARAGCKTINDVIELAKNGDLKFIKNFGRTSMMEVLNALKSRYDLDLFDEYGIVDSRDNAS